MTRQRRSATLEEVARVAGVSRATVSRVVNGASNVSSAARESVALAIETLGYVPNRAARSLATQRSDSVALVVTESERRFFSEPFFAGIVRGVGEKLAEENLQMVLMMVHGEAEHERLERYLVSGHVDGAVLLSVHGGDPLPRTLTRRGLPVVMGGRSPDGYELPYVDADNVGGGRAATLHLVEIGRRRIAHIAGPADMPVGHDRAAGYDEALQEAGLTPDPRLRADGDFSRESGARAMEDLLRYTPDLDAVFAASDLMAVGAMEVLREHGREVPGDVAVVGFDDSIVATSSQPTLTTVRQPVDEMGRQMASLLLAGIAGDQERPASVVVPTELVRRNST